MAKYRFKTKEEFIRDDLWNAISRCPKGWNSAGEMNKYMGQPILSREVIASCDKGHNFNFEKWSFSEGAYTLISPYFEVDKWYSFKAHPSDTENQICKVNTIGNEHMIGSPWIINSYTYDPKGTWGTSDLSDIQEISVDDPIIQKYLPKDHPDKIKEIVAPLVVGKWYKNLGEDKNYIGKYLRTTEEGDHFVSEYIYYKNHKICAGIILFTHAVECPLEEIQEFLPKGHPDLKTSQIFIDGMWYNNLGTNKGYIAKAKIKPGSNKGELWHSCYILDGQYSNESGWFHTNLETEKVSLHDIQEYLPFGHVDKFPDFIKGMWYRSSKWGTKMFAKFDKFTAVGNFGYSEIYFNNKHQFLCSHTTNDEKMWNSFLLMSKEEIEEYLPKGHPDREELSDRLKLYIPGFWYKYNDAVYLKYLKSDGDKFIASERIVDKRHTSIICNYNLKNIIPLFTEEVKKYIHPYLPKGHSDLPDKHPFIKDKWYRSSKWGYFKAAKFSQLDAYGNFFYSEHIKDKYIPISGTTPIYDKDWSTFKEVPLDMLQKYLPENHPDKISNSMVGFVEQVTPPQLPSISLCKMVDKLNAYKYVAGTDPYEKAPISLASTKVELLPLPKIK